MPPIQVKNLQQGGKKERERAILSLRSNFCLSIRKTFLGSSPIPHIQQDYDSLQLLPGILKSKYLVQSTQPPFLNIYSLTPDSSLTFCLPGHLPYISYYIPFKMCPIFTYSYLSLRELHCVCCWDLPFHGVCLVSSSLAYVLAPCLLNFFSHVKCKLNSKYTVLKVMPWLKKKKL